MKSLIEPNIAAVLPLDPACLTTEEERRAVAKMPRRLRHFLDGALNDMEPWEVAEERGLSYKHRKNCEYRIRERLHAASFEEAVGVYALALAAAKQNGAPA